ncbi:unnamed protein product [Urochloa humidicola]
MAMARSWCCSAAAAPNCIVALPDRLVPAAAWLIHGGGKASLSAEGLSTKQYCKSQGFLQSMELKLFNDNDAARGDDRYQTFMCWIIVPTGGTFE